MVLPVDFSPTCQEPVELESCEIVFQLMPFYSGLNIASILYFNVILIIQTSFLVAHFFPYVLLEVLKSY